MYSKVIFSFETGCLLFVSCVCVFVCVCVSSGSKTSVSACPSNWVIGCLLTMGLAFKKRTMSALSLELFTWKSPSGASLTHPHDPRQQNMECISNPAQKYELQERWVLLRILDVWWFSVLCVDVLLHWVGPFLRNAWKVSVNVAFFLLVFSHFQRITHRKWSKFYCSGKKNRLTETKISKQSSKKWQQKSYCNTLPLLMMQEEPGAVHLAILTI